MRTAVLLPRQRLLIGTLCSQLETLMRPLRTLVNAQSKIASVMWVNLLPIAWAKISQSERCVSPSTSCLALPHPDLSLFRSGRC